MAQDHCDQEVGSGQFEVALRLSLVFSRGIFLFLIVTGGLYRGGRWRLTSWRLGPGARRIAWGTSTVRVEGAVARIDILTRQLVSFRLVPIFKQRVILDLMQEIFVCEEDALGHGEQRTREGAVPRFATGPALKSPVILRDRSHCKPNLLWS